MSTPRNTDLQAIPVAGRDSMLHNLSGAHGPFFTRNIVIAAGGSALLKSKVGDYIIAYALPDGNTSPAK